MVFVCLEVFVLTETKTETESETVKCNSVLWHDLSQRARVGATVTSACSQVCRV